MTKEQYDAVLAGLTSVPERHLVVHGVQVHSRDELNRLAAKWGYNPATQPALVAAIEAEPVIETPVVPEPVILTPVVPPTGASEGEQAEPPKEEEEKKPEEPEKPKEPESDSSPEIPENLGTLKFGELKALAKKLGIDPVPSTQPALVAAIEAKRSA